MSIAGSTSTHAPEATVRFGAGLTDIDGLLVGHQTMTERPTGCTAVLIPNGAVAGVAQRGGAPGSREVGLLDPANSVQEIHGVVLSGGSAFGLDAAGGTVRYLEEQGVGYDMRVAKVPIVVSAILFDLEIGNLPHIRPAAECGYLAARNASSQPGPTGNVGAGAGATVGKARGPAFGMKGGLGSASITTPDGLVVAALVAVNAVGDVVDPATGKIVAGARSDDGQSFADARRLVQGPPVEHSFGPAENTTIGVVATNAALTKAQATRMALMGDDGFARTIYPAHTPSDGDTLFALGTGTWDGPTSVSRIGALGAQMVAEAILVAIETAESIAGFPSARELNTTRSEVPG